MSDDRRRPPTLSPNLVERLMKRDLDERRPPEISRRALQAQRTVESYLNAGVKPRWMARLMEIDRAVRSTRDRLARDYRRLQAECEGDAAAFAGRWRAAAAECRFDELNALIRQHNDWYPIERDLPMDPRTGDYVLISGRSYRRPELDEAWVLEHFPADAA